MPNSQIRTFQRELERGKGMSTSASEAKSPKPDGKCVITEIPHALLFGILAVNNHLSVGQNEGIEFPLVDGVGTV